MASLIPGYKYDVFISYRQKDNKGEKWVTGFVEALKTELESTFKDEISVYFDINSYDGLLETYDVEASLKEKLNCLIFIPILSRTYCDPRSFAWEHEFKAFVSLASKDKFGLKVKLPNGNIMNRVLPVCIHELDTSDIHLFESVTGAALRGIEFIYKEPGVNKPLTYEDDERRNFNGTRYILQINKVANAIRELIHGLNEEQDLPGKDKKNVKSPSGKKEFKMQNRTNTITGKPVKSLLAAGAFILLSIMALTLLVWPKVFNKNPIDKLKSSGKRIAVAVMPFQNMTSDTSWNVWQDGIQNELINNLTNSKELIIKQVEPLKALIQSKGLTSYASMTPTIAGNISQKLNANIFIYGNIKKAGEIIRISAQIIDPETQESIKSFQINGPPELILNMTDSLSKMVNNFLIVSELRKELPSFDKTYLSTSSPEALRFFIYGQNYFFKQDFPSAQDWLIQAVKVDSNFTQAISMLSLSYYNEYNLQLTISAYGNDNLIGQAKKWCLIAYRKKELVSIQEQININRIYAMCFETPKEVITCLNQLMDLDDQNPNIYFNLGSCYYDLYEYDKAIPEFEKGLDLYKKWGLKPKWSFDYAYLGEAYRKTGKTEAEEKLFKIAEEDFPGDPFIAYNQSVLALTKYDTLATKKYSDTGISYLKSIALSDASIYAVVASAYADAGRMDEAEKYYKKATALEPHNPFILNNLGYFLINNNRNIDAGIESAQKALELIPDYYDFQHTEGWGLFKKGKFKEAYDLLQKSWDSRMKNAVYSHDAFLHLEAAKKALADLK
jgi:tetratricopeptide (TPR) repeat protein